LAIRNQTHTLSFFLVFLTIILFPRFHQTLLLFVSSDTNDALHYYSHDNAITTNGVLSITTEQKENVYKAFNEKTKKFFVDSKYIQSAMLQGWNKFCITGGIVEFSAKLPGDPSTGGLWPARTFIVFCFFFSFHYNDSMGSDTFDFSIHP
jgi:beta-glucanase (GH16 family)